MQLDEHVQWSNSCLLRSLLFADTESTLYSRSNIPEAKITYMQEIVPPEYSVLAFPFALGPIGRRSKPGFQVLYVFHLKSALRDHLLRSFLKSPLKWISNIQFPAKYLSEEPHEQIAVGRTSKLAALTRYYI